MTSRRTFLFGTLACGAVGWSGCRVTPAGRAEARRREVVSASSLSNPGGRILFIKSHQLWRWQNGSVGALATGAHFADPAWSPSGGRIALVQKGTNHSDVFVSDAQGANGLQITSHWSRQRVQDSAWARRPSWSPDGEHLVYASDLGGTDLSLWVADVPGRNPRRILLRPRFAGGVDWPSWSPDGEQIAFTVHDAERSQIHVLTLSNGAEVRLTEFEGGAYDPAWSPDGERIAFVFRNGGRHVIAVMDADGANVVRLVETGMARAPTWSPDGTQIAYVGLKNASFDIFTVPAPPRATHESVTGAPREQGEQLTENLHLEAECGISWTA